MPLYSFEGRNAQGMKVNGELDGTSVDAIAGQLLGRGITPTTIQETVERIPLEVRFQALLGNQKIEVEELIIFCRQMYTVTKAGLPLTRGVRGLADSLNHYVLRKALLDIVERLETGVELSSAMGHYPDIFDSLFLSIIQVGENSGRLDEAFLQLAIYLERQLDTSRRISSALRYPMFVMIALAVGMVVINIWVIPAFANMFSSFNTQLPLPTRVLMGISQFFVDYWPHMLVGVVSVIVGWRKFLQTEKGQLFWGEQKLNLPVVGGIINRGSMARYSRSFSLMLKSGVPLPRALTLCSKTIDNAYLGKKISTIKQSVERGESLSRTHQASNMFTPLVLQMVAVGEETGQLESLLTEVADFYERELDYEVGKLGDRIEPILIVIMAFAVLVLALGIFLPMWEMYNVTKG